MDKTISGALLKEIAGLADAVYDDNAIRGKLFEKFKNKQNQENKDDVTFEIILNDNVTENKSDDSIEYTILDIAEESNGFAAMLVKKTGGDNSNNIEYAIVSRGTEFSDVRDIYTDIKVLTSNFNKQYPSADKFTNKALETIKNDLNLSSIDEAKEYTILVGHSLGGNHAQIIALEHDLKAYTINPLPATNIIEQKTLEKLQKSGSFNKEQVFDVLQGKAQKANENIVNILSDDDFLINGAKFVTKGNLGQNVIIKGAGHSIGNK